VSKPEIKDFPASIHDRLLNQARLIGRPFNELLQYYAIERFLYRLSRSRHAGKFILKGALLFRIWGLATSRSTRDIDLLGFTSNEVGNLVAIIQEVCKQEVEQDGLIFVTDTVTGERIDEDADYEGVRLRFSGLLGRARIHLQIDIGFSDVVTPVPGKKTYPVILPLPAPELQSYPPETVIAEKLQTLVFLGSVNSRMKDFYDLWFLADRFEFDGDVLQEAISATFEHRHTVIPAGEPVAFSEQFAREKQSQWKAFLATSFIEDAPDSLAIIIGRLQGFILPILQSIQTGQKFRKKWKPGGPWK
jgi:predicted nucleotidyltransferase component of viral defense system